MSSSLLKIATLPVQTLVALRKISTSVHARTRSKSISASITSRSRIDVERVGQVRTEALGNDICPGLVAPEAEYPAEKSALRDGKRPVDAGPAPEGFERAARTVNAALQPAVHHHNGIHGAGTRTGDRIDREAPVFEQGVEHSPGEGAVGSAALQRQRYRLLGNRSREAADLAGVASIVAGHRAGPLAIPSMNDALIIEALTTLSILLASAMIPPGGAFGHPSRSMECATRVRRDS